MAHLTSVRAAVVAFGSAVLLSTGPLGSAWAHTSIVGSDPSDGQTLRREPRTVSVSFTEPPLPTGLAMVAVGPQGRLPLTPSARGNSVAAPWPSGSPNGTYTVSYRVVAADGHPITGEVTFRLNAAADRSAPRATAPEQPTIAAQAAEEPTESSIPVWLWLVGAALIAAGGYLAISRGRRVD